MVQERIHLRSVGSLILESHLRILQSGLELAYCCLELMDQATTRTDRERHYSKAVRLFQAMQTRTLPPAWIGSLGDQAREQILRNQVVTLRQRLMSTRP